MPLRCIISWMTIAVALIAGPVAAQQLFDESKYPAFEGQWIRIGAIERYDQTKPPARGQEAPLTPEYQAVFEANLADVAKGGFGVDPVYACILEGMPRAMNLILPIEIVINRNTPSIMMEYLGIPPPLFTDRRNVSSSPGPSCIASSL